MSSTRSESERACLARLVEMEAALRAMVAELPPDSVPLGEEALAKVLEWKLRLGQGGADLEALSGAMSGISELMDALTSRLLLQPWDGPKGALRS